MSSNPQMPAGVQAALDENEYRPPLPQRPAQRVHTEAQQEGDWPAYNPADFEHPQTHVQPQHGGEWPVYNPADYENRPSTNVESMPTSEWPAYDPAAYTNKPTASPLVPPPQRTTFPVASTDPAIHYLRDPRKITAYLVPMPTPQLKDANSMAIPMRFMIYTPPAPMLKAPPEGVKEGKLHKVQRKWQEEVRNAKTNEAKLASWQGMKGRATKGINWAMNKTTSSNLDFLGRVSPGPSSDSDQEHSDTKRHSSGSTSAQGVESKTAKQKKPKAEIDEITLIYPTSVTLSEPELREEFVNSMLRTKSKAQRDTIIATGLMPVTYGIDILATLVWPFGGLGEINTVWAYKSFRGAKTATDVTKRLSAADQQAQQQGSAVHAPTGVSADPAVAAIQQAGHHPQPDIGSGISDRPLQQDYLQPPPPQQHADSEKESKLRLTFTPSSHVEILAQYLLAECHKENSTMFPGYQTSPTETQVMEAIGWTPSTKMPQIHTHSYVSDVSQPQMHPQSNDPLQPPQTVSQTGNVNSGLPAQPPPTDPASTVKPPPTAEELKRKHAEDTAYEVSQFKEDLKNEMQKAAREWQKWCKLFEKDPDKALGIKKEKNEK